MHKLHESTAAVGTESLGEGKYRIRIIVPGQGSSGIHPCLLYPSDAADALTPT